MATDETLNELLNEALENLDSALMLTLKSSRSEKQNSYKIGTLGRSIGLVNCRLIGDDTFEFSYCCGDNRRCHFE